MKEACLYEKLEKGRVQCFLCNHRCLIREGSKGICGVRANRGGTLETLVYGKVIARHVDPIEKKPLFHYLPGSRSYSLATVGCNFKCTFCQNADISQMPADRDQIWGEEIAPSSLVEEALSSRADSISYTYTEPTIFFEYALDTSRLAVKQGLRNVFVSNGYMTEECLKEIYPDLHAANVDLKAFTEKFYREQCGARLDPILKTLRSMKEMGVWLEVTTLLISGLNDSPEELRNLAQFLSGLDPDIPWHISRFHPAYRRMDLPPTPAKSVQRARDIGHEAGLKYVYTGNLPGDEGEKTFCHSCKQLLIDRYGFSVQRNVISQNRCPTCSALIPGVWSQNP